MGFFAVVKPRGGERLNEPSTEEFEVEKLDVNVWCLPRLFGRFLIYCDVGVRLKATTRVTQFDLAIPFHTDASALTDLCGVLGDSETAALVFGEPVVDENNHPIDESGDYSVRRAIAGEQSRLLPTLSNETFSLWRIVPRKAQAAGTTNYYRVRLRATDFGRTWTWRRSFLRRVAALVDLHFCDPRDAALVPHGPRYEDDLVPIGELNAFVIVPDSFRMRKTSPELRYLRVLEGRRWERYLNRATDLRRREKFLVHFWRAPTEKPVGIQKEFRAFLELGRNTESIGWPAILAIGATAGVVVLLLDQDVDRDDSPLGRAVAAATAALGDFLLSWTAGPITLVAVLALFVLFSNSIERLRPLRGWIRSV